MSLMDPGSARYTFRSLERLAGGSEFRAWGSWLFWVRAQDPFTFHGIWHSVHKRSGLNTFAAKLGPSALIRPSTNCQNLDFLVPNIAPFIGITGSL